MELIQARTDRQASWTANEPPTFAYNYAGAAAGWRDEPGAIFRWRDLGLGRASGALMSARHCRGTETPGTAATGDADFRFFYVLGGALTIEDATGENRTLARGGVALLGPRIGHVTRGATTEAEWIEIAAAGAGFDMPAPRTLYLDETPGSYVVGAGPRRYFAYRDLATAEFTGRRIHIHVVKALEPMPGGTGWHNHTMSQLFVVLTGWAKIAVEGRGERVMRAGDAMCLGAGMRHDVPAYSADYTVLEMCVPADYDTTATPAPAA